MGVGFFYFKSMYVEDQMRNTKNNKGPEENEKALQELKETGECSGIELEKMNLNALTNTIRKRVQNIYDMKRQAASPSKPSREEADSRSVFVGNVKYCCTIDELDQHFQSCGTVKKVTVGTDLNGKSRGFAFVEFLEPEAVQKALLLNESILHGRQLKVSAKRTNIPGMRQSSGSQHFIHSTGYRSKICLDPIKENLVKLEKKIPSKSSSFIVKDNVT